VTTINWREKQVLTKSDCAKYPFTPKAAEYVKTLDIKINELASPEYKSILDRAESRIEEAILFRTMSQKSPNDDIEILICASRSKTSF